MNIRNCGVVILKLVENAPISQNRKSILDQPSSFLLGCRLYVCWLFPGLFPGYSTRHPATYAWWCMFCLSYRWRLASLHWLWLHTAVFFFVLFVLSMVCCFFFRFPSFTTSISHRVSAGLLACVCMLCFSYLFVQNAHHYHGMALLGFSLLAALPCTAVLYQVLVLSLRRIHCCRDQSLYDVWYEYLGGRRVDRTVTYIRNAKNNTHTPVS